MVAQKQQHNDKKEVHRLQRFLFSASTGVVFGILFIQLVNKVSGVDSAPAVKYLPDGIENVDNIVSEIGAEVVSEDNWICNREFDPIDTVEMDRVRDARGGTDFEVPFYLYEDEKDLGSRAMLSCITSLAGLADSCSSEPCTLSLADLLASRMLDSTFHTLASDLILLEQLRHHPWRTSDPAKASVFVLDYAPSLLAKFPKDWADWGCSSPAAGPPQAAFAKNAIALLNGSAMFKKSSGRDHLLFFNPAVSSPVSTKRMSPAFRQVVAKGPVIVATSDDRWPMGADDPNKPRAAKTGAKGKKKSMKRATDTSSAVLARRAVVVPALPLGGLLARSSQSDPYSEFIRRKYPVFAYPALSPEATRADPVALLAGRVKGMAFPGMRGGNGLGKRTRVLAENQMVARLVMNSQFCLTFVEDDNFDQLYSFLAGGCIPVILSPFPALPLPFPSVVHWEEAVVSWKGIECLTENVEAVAAKLTELRNWAMDTKNKGEVTQKLKAVEKAANAVKYMSEIPNYAHESSRLRKVSDWQEQMERVQTPLAENILRQVVLERLVDA